MKTLKYLLIFALLFSITISMNAAVTTWIGGIGNWDEATNWDTGAVPSLNDGVIINNGTVTVEYYAEASYIHLDGGNLDVNGTLYVVTETGWYDQTNQVMGMVIENGSTFNNYGATIMQESGNYIGIQKFIFCDGDMTNHSNGIIVLIGANSTGIHSYSLSGTIYNYGEIIMNTVQTGLFLINPFSNYGNIEITSSSIGIINADSFYSGSASNLVVNGRVTNNTGAVWNQYGNVEIHYTTTSNASALSNSGTFEIQNGGSLIIDGSYGAINLTSNSTFRVRGDLEISNDKLYTYVLANQGFFVNHQKGVIHTQGYYGVFNDNNASMLNYGIWNMEDPQGTYYCTLWNRGVMSNRPKGKLYVSGRLNLKIGSMFNNQGHMFVLDDVSHEDVSGNFNNTGTLNDVHDQMTSINNNTSIRVHKTAGPWTEGVPVSNVLDVGNNPGSTVLSWYTTPSGSTIAGTYNSSTNTFTPNANAVGLTSLFVRTRINSVGVTRRHELIVENGINGSPSPLHQPGPQNTAVSLARMTIAPNPISSSFSINLENYTGSKLSYTIHNSMGQKMDSGEFDSKSNFIQVPPHLSAGIYFLSVFDPESKLLDTQKIRIINQ